MAVASGIGINLYHPCPDGNLNFFNRIEHQRTQSPVKTIEVYYIREPDAGPYKPMVRFLCDIILKWISICPQPIITYIGQIPLGKPLVVDQQSTAP